MLEVLQLSFFLPERKPCVREYQISYLSIWEFVSLSSNLSNTLVDFPYASEISSRLPLEPHKQSLRGIQPLLRRYKKAKDHPSY
ncbi:hypothetical protein I7I50_08474 [Histoplasma capsulatum G186AR]|uniref:Uncharacterized protein n=1 Tax=Ajellomyces capsulatus TaxID=5037 RepID=A0A8H7YNJ6_AJECA|nr:hypothetical protein I7I52_05989 [Histoplasma capsulatum]QSS73625.1 hypothetical protein I7I50_08474 [Histoplasma capsulatum G186AR]